MDLDRGTLAKVDRSLLSGLGHDQQYQMVRVPASEAVWSTWRRYCEALGISMGRAIAALIQHEIRSVVDEPERRPVFLVELEARLNERHAANDARERQLDAREQRLRVNERQVMADPVRPRPLARGTKVGRNDPCPCGSGLKYKRCHGT